jgi:hypothetical protein
MPGHYLMNAIDGISERMLHVQECDLIFWSGGMVYKELEVINIREYASTDTP